MGNIASVFVSVSVDYLSGSITAMLSEKIFPKYDATKPKYISLFEGITQLTGSVITVDFLSSLLTPSGAKGTDMLGMVGMMYFVFLFSPNMKAKLASVHATTKEITGLQ